jgi:hypothetical protein
MRYLTFGIAALLACAAPTDANYLGVPDLGDEAVVRPAVVTVTVTPLHASTYPAGTVQYIATARDGEGRLLKASQWKWSSSDTTIAKVSSTGLVTARVVGNGIIAAVAYPPWRLAK